MVLGLERRSMGLILLAIATAIAPLIIGAARKNPQPVPSPSSWKEPDDERERRDRRAFLLLGVLSTLGAAYGFFLTDGSLAGLVSGICLSLVAVFSVLAWQGRRRRGD
jgi:drug/metabolite transporter (DMT)-like permease